MLEDLLEAIVALEVVEVAIPERDDEFTEWCGQGFDPTLVETDWIERELTKLAKRWSRNRKPAAPRKQK